MGTEIKYILLLKRVLKATFSFLILLLGHNDSSKQNGHNSRQMNTFSKCICKTKFADNQHEWLVLLIMYLHGM